MEIRRLHGIDNEGILVIGESADLRHRLETFYKAANGKTAAHSEGQRYYYFRIAELNRNGIEFRYEETLNRKVREREELKRYELKHRELPPLNRAGGWPGYERKDEIKQMPL
jgi:hypothetical protein